MFRRLAEKRVEAGIELLDKALPGWEEKIDLGSLNISNFKNCMLGQLYSDYDTGRKALNIPHSKVSSLGFNHSLVNPTPFLVLTWLVVAPIEILSGYRRTLNTVWREKIWSRKTKVSRRNEAITV